MTRPYAEVIGDPISQSKSPLIHGFWLERLGIAADYRACHVKPAELRNYFTQRRADPDWRGCNVTIPHKLAALASVDEVSEAGRHVGAINTVWRDAQGAMCSTNTDVDGVAAAIGAQRSVKAVVIGAGGAARAAFTTLAAMNDMTVTTLARSPDKASAALAECRLRSGVMPFEAGTGAFEGASLAINATQLGMAGQDPMPPFVLEELAGMAPGGLVFDMVYAPLETGLLKAARCAGLDTADGLVMLVGQAATAFERFFGCPPPREQDEELRRILTS